MDDTSAKKESYHHGALRGELIRLGLEALERDGAEALSLRSLAEAAGVSKTAPYRHFRDKERFLGVLADEGFRQLCAELEAAVGEGPERVARMGRAYMAFALRRPALYRLMNSPLFCRMPAELIGWARRSLMLLAAALADGGRDAPGGKSAAAPDMDATTAVWAYIHGLVLLRIDGLYPADLPEPDWERLAGTEPSVSLA